MRQLTSNQPSRTKGLKMVFKSKFCAEFENPAGLGALRHQGEAITYPTLFSKYIAIMSLLMYQLCDKIIQKISRNF